MQAVGVEVATKGVKIIYKLNNYIINLNRLFKRSYFTYMSICTFVSQKTFMPLYSNDYFKFLLCNWFSAFIFSSNMLSFLSPSSHLTFKSLLENILQLTDFKRKIKSFHFLGLKISTL